MGSWSPLFGRKQDAPEISGLSFGSRTTVERRPRDSPAIESRIFVKYELSWCVHGPAAIFGSRSVFLDNSETV